MAGGSELRQRKGQMEEDQVPANKEEVVRLFQDKMRSAMEEKVRTACVGNETESEIQSKIDEGLNAFFEPKKKPLPGLKDSTKAAKDALAENPYDLDAIFDLGEAYMMEEKYAEAGNVLVRGWKRMGEIQAPEHRFLFLFQLCHASFQCAKMKQALAVLMDIEEPEDAEMLSAYCRLSCKVYAHNDNLQKALKAFHKCLELCKDFDAALPVWADTVTSLRKVGAYDAARSSLEQLAPEESDKQKIKVVEAVNDLKSCINDPIVESRFPMPMVLAVGAVVFFIFIYLLFLLESRSLKSLNLKPK